MDHAWRRAEGGREPGQHQEDDHVPGTDLHAVLLIKDLRYVLMVA
jgi:hypothetical protein